MACTTKVPEILKRELAGGQHIDIAEVFKNVYAIVDAELTEFEYEGCTATTVFIWEKDGFNCHTCGLIVFRSSISSMCKCWRQYSIFEEKG